MTTRRFAEVDVFAAVPCGGNPLAVVLDSGGLDDATMRAFAHWTHLSETTFLSAPGDPRADYRVRIFTATRELPFAGHPTLGSAHAWLAAGGVPKRAGVVVQECGVGLVEVRHDPAQLAFAAPPLQRDGPVAPGLAARIVRGLRVEPAKVRAVQWVDNGPGWIGVLLDSAHSVLALAVDRNALRGLDVGVIGAHPDGDPADFEVRAFFTDGELIEDPVTGSLNASLAQWLTGAGLAPPRYCVRQGTAVGADGRVAIERHGDTVWVGGACTTRISGTLQLQGRRT